MKRALSDLGKIFVFFSLLTLFPGCVSQKINSNMDSEAITEQHYDLLQEYDKTFSSIANAYYEENGYVNKESVESFLNNVERSVQKGVELGDIDHYVRGENNIYMEFSGGIGYVFEPTQEGILSGGGSSKIYVLEPQHSNWDYVITRWMSTPGKAFGFWIDSILNEADFNFSLLNILPANTTREVTAFFPEWNAPGAQQVLQDENVTINSMKNLAEYKIVIFVGHGCYIEDSSIISAALTTDEIVPDWKEFSIYKDDIADKSLILQSSGQGIKRYAITKRFIDKYIGDMTDALVYLGACYSCKDAVDLKLTIDKNGNAPSATLANAFLNKGAAAVLGYSAPIEIPNEAIARIVLFRTLAEIPDAFSPECCNTLEDAFSNAYMFSKDRTGAELVCCGEYDFVSRWTLCGYREAKPDVDAQLDLTDYLDDIKAMHSVIGGESSSEAGDYEKWYQGDEVRYGNYEESTRVDTIYIDSNKYSLYKITVGQDIDEIESHLLDLGWDCTEVTEVAYDKEAFERYKFERENQFIEIDTINCKADSYCFWRMPEWAIEQ